jgi:hypothetical protein
VRVTARIALTLLAVLVAALHLPALYDVILADPPERTHLLFSPVMERFVWTERLVGEAPPEARAKAEDHHASIAYRDEDGGWHSRREFEELLPFIYYKNMELWGLMPLRLGGREFDSEAVRAGRQVMELAPADLPGGAPGVPLHALLESNPPTARLVFPEDRFRLAGDGLRFVNADTNAEDAALSARFNDALRVAGFVFPARFAGGSGTILKPFDDGMFLVDARHAVFHLKRVDGEPEVVRTPIPEELRTRCVKIFESRRKEFHGLLLSESGILHLLRWNYEPVALDLPGYEPDAMHCKIIVDPLHVTAVWNDEATVSAQTMDRSFRPLRRFGMRMARAERTAVDEARDALFPFRLTLGGEGFRRVGLAWGSPWALAVNAALAALLLGWSRARGGRCRPAHLGLVACCGVYGLLAGAFVFED